MLPFLVLGVTYAFAAAVQPGQFQAYLVAESIAHGWRKTLPAALAPLLSDLPIVCLVVLVLTRIPAPLVRALQLGGGVYLLYLAWRALQAWRTYHPATSVPAGSAHRRLMQAAFVNLLNPNPYIGWALVLGPLLLQAWAISVAYAAAFLFTFYLTMAAGNAAFIVLFASARIFGPALPRSLLGASAVALAGFGVFQISIGMMALL